MSPRPAWPPTRSSGPSRCCDCQRQHQPHHRRARYAVHQHDRRDRHDVSSGVGSSSRIRWRTCLQTPWSGRSILAPAALAADGLISGYGRIRILDSVSVSLSAGEVVAVIGHNGMGKTTLLRTLAGLLKAKSGSVHLAGRDVTHHATAARSRLGLGYVPQGRPIFPDLTALENIMI